MLSALYTYGISPLILHLTAGCHASAVEDICLQVIAENIKNGGDLNAMVPGQKVTFSASGSLLTSVLV